MAKAMALHPVATSVTGLGASLETTHNLFSMFRRFFGFGRYNFLVT